MPVKQGSIELLQHPASQELLRSKIPARLAYVWTDGTPRVVPIWFHWNGNEFILGTPAKAPKLKALAKNPRVALTIDDNQFPHKVLLVRGTATLKPVNGIVPEYALAQALLRRATGKSMGGAARSDGPGDGAHRHYAGVGRFTRLSVPLSQRTAALSETAGRLAYRSLYGRPRYMPMRSTFFTRMSCTLMLSLPSFSRASDTRAWAASCRW